MTEKTTGIFSLMRTGLAIALALLGTFAIAPTARADFVFGTFGSGAGQTNHPKGVAVDSSDGTIYVADAGNNRIDVFNSDGSFIRAFGWGVADGTTAALQTCTATCFRGLPGGGAGEFDDLSSVAVDNDSASSAYHDIYALDGNRIEELTPSGEFLLTWGGGVISGGASGAGDLSSGSSVITNVKTTKKAFALGQEVAGAGIPAGAKIVAIGENDTITLSMAANASGAAVALSVAEGAGNLPQNEVQTLTLPEDFAEHQFALVFRGLDSIPIEEETTLVPNNASAAQIQAALVGLASVDPGDVSVTSPNPGGGPGLGGPYTFEFKGRFADADVRPLRGTGGSRTNNGFATIQNGAAAAEICTAAHASDCSAGVAGNKAGQFDSNPRLSFGSGSVHLTDETQVGRLVLVGGEDPAGHLRLQRFDPTGALLDTVPPSSEIVTNQALSAGSGGNYYVGSGAVVRKFDSSGKLLSIINPGSDLGSPCGIGSLAVDPSNDLFIGCSGDRVNGVFIEYDTSATPQRVLYSASSLASNGLAFFHTAVGDIVGAQGSGETSQVSLIPFPPPGPVIFNSETPQVGNVRATMKASFNPEGKATTVHFQYVDDASFQSGGFANPATQTTPESAPSEADFKQQSASVAVQCNSQAPSEAGCLTPNTTYHFRAIATNADGSVSGPATTFETLPPIRIGESWSTDVSLDAATLHAVLNPSSLPTIGHFEYVDDATYRTSGFAEAKEAPDVVAGAVPFDFGSGEAEVERSAPLFGLAPNTTYHYRLVATDHFGSFTGPEGTLTTFRPIPADTKCPNQGFRDGASARLADCRAYEMVSPLDKNNADIVSPLDLLLARESFYESSSDGQKVTYSSFRAFGDVKGGPMVSQYLASRGANGWSTHALNPPQGTNIGPGLPGVSVLANQFVAFSNDLSTSWLWQQADPPLAPGGQPGYPNLYRRDNDTDTYTALSTVKPPNIAPYQADAGLSLVLQGFSADGTRAVFTANDKLTANAASPQQGGRTTQLYEYFGASKTRLVSVLPNGTASLQFASLGNGESLHPDRRGAQLTHAVSEDGSRIFWTASAAQNGFGSIYVRIGGTKTIAVGSGTFLAADPQGTRAIFVTNGGNLEEFDVDTQTTTTIAQHVVLPFLREGDHAADASEDLSRIYFSSTDVLAPGATAGQPNLYFYEEGHGFTFIGRGGGVTNGFFNPGERRYLTPDGLHMDFESRAPLTGYDNTDASEAAASTPLTQGGAADREVYRYDAETKTLLCVSCNPSGSRPAGADIDQSLTVQDWVAAQLPERQRALYARRSLSDDGSRLFFESYDALLPTDTNGTRDVYEWEEAGSGDCTTEDANYFKPNGGCLSLISSGTSPGDAEFVDASADGSDAFFTTESSLLPQDYGLIDVYDAREDGGLPPPPVPPPACEGEACQGPLAPPNDPTPGSSSYEGPGNPVAAKKAKKKKHAKKSHKVKQKSQSQAKHNRKGQR